MSKLEQKFMVFLESLYDQEPKLMGTIMKGFELVYKKDAPENPNPYALTDVIDKPDPYYDPSRNNDKVETVLSDGEQKIVNDVCKRFNIKPNDVKDDYLLYNQHLAPFQYLEKIKDLTEWKTRAYYNDEKDEYYGMVKRGYETPIDNKYGHSGIPSGRD